MLVDLEIFVTRFVPNKSLGYTRFSKYVSIMVTASWLASCVRYYILNKLKNPIST
jgi:hypothetical protein